MNRVTIVEKSATLRIGKEPVVVVPLKLWRQIEDYLEDQEALASPKFLRRIRKGRKDTASGKLVHPLQAINSA